MPSSKPIVLAAVAMVVLAGCSALPGGGNQQTTTTLEPPAHSELVFQSSNGGEAFTANVTVRRGGATVFETTIQAAGSGTYRNLTTIEGNGSYTVTVNTTVSGAGGSRSERFTVEDPSGHAAAIRVRPLGVYHHVFDLPRRSLEYPLGAYHNALPDDMAAGSEVDVRVWYRGERVNAATKSIPGSELTRVVELNETGAYRVAARGTGGEWHTDVFVVEDPERHIKVRLKADGTVEDIAVVPAGWQ